MKSIKERAKEASPFMADQVWYIQGATEQKAIDINKAIKAHCSFCKAHNACVDRGAFYCPETEHIRKAMEE